MKTISVYTTPNCQQCTATKRWLDRAGIEYQTIDLTDDPESAAAVRDLGYKSAPVIIVSTGDPETDLHWYGFAPTILARYCTDVAS